MRVHYARKKPVTVMVTDPVTPENKAEIMAWADNTWEPYFEDSGYAFTIDTIDGEFYVGYGDRVIKGTAGEFYKIDGEIFLATYDLPVPHG